MMYNKAELKAMQIIANKLNWNKPAYETVETITKMVHNQQTMELDCIGECDDYHSLVNYKYSLFLEDMGITEEDYKAMLNYYVNISGEAMAAQEEIELEDYYHYLDLCDDYASREY